MRVKNIGTVITGKTPITSNAENYSSDDYMFVTPDDILDDTYIINKTKRYISRSGLQSISTNSISGTSIAVTCIGDVGRCAILQDICATNQQINSITNIDTSIVNPIALYYWFKLCGKQLVNYASQTVMPIVSKSTFEDIEVSLPSLGCQNTLANLLSRIDDLINNNKQLSGSFSSFIKMIYDYWFVQFDFPDENGRPYKSSGGKMVYNEQLKQEIPEGWTAQRILDIASWTSGAQPPKSEHIDHFEKGYIRFIQNRDYSSDKDMRYIPISKSNKLCDRYDIMMDKYGDAGRTRFGLAGAYNVALAKISPKKESMREYLRGFLAQSAVYNFLHESCMASTRASLNASILNQLVVPIPDDQLLNKFNNFSKNAIDLLLTIEDESKLLASLCDWLLPMLINGQVEIKNEPQQ